MLDLNWGELAVIGVVALVVIGPKDLPKAMRVAGGWVRKARGMAADFHAAVDQMTREAELQELKEKLAEAEAHNRKLLEETKASIDPGGEIEKALQPPVLPDLDPPPVIPPPLPLNDSPAPLAADLQGPPLPVPATDPVQPEASKQP